MARIKLLELFGGIGACTAALERLGADFEVVDYVEIDKYAVKSYNAIHGTDFLPQDIKHWDKDIEVDMIMHGSPCQDFSIAGRQAGGDMDSGTRSSLMYETIRIVKKLKPKYVIWENVRNLLSNKHRHNFDNYIRTLEEIGYKNYYSVLNARDYGIPQNRQRVFTISILGDDDFRFPDAIPLELKLADLLEDDVDESYFLSDKGIKYITSDKRIGKYTNINPDVAMTVTAKGMQNWTGTMVQVAQMYGTEREPNPQAGRVYSPDGCSPCLDTCTGGNRMPKITTCDSETRIRKLTPKECWRLMGFPDAYYDKAAEVNSRTQLYKQAGNSIVVDVLVKIFENLLEVRNEKEN